MKTSRFLFIIMCLTILIFNSQAADSDKKMIKKAEKAAEKWLSVVDSGKYEDSWRMAATLSMDTVPKDKWVESFKAARNPLGKFVSRKVNKSQHLKTMRGAPEGDYVVIQYHSVFKGKADVVETIITAMDKEGDFRVMSYYVK